ncbi:MAG: hypothetical protein WBD96_19810 [Pseudolabrys sp.]
MTDRRQNPRSEPEIIPPGAEPRPPQIPFSFILVILIVGLMSAALLVLLMGALLIALPAIIVLVTAALVVGLLRMYFQR